MKTFAAISLFTTVAVAQSSYSSAAPPTATGNPYIPDNISGPCKAFFDSFNKNSALTACTDSLIQATKNFGPGGSSSTPSKAEVTGAVDSICTGPSSSACPDSLIRGALTDFYAACPDELTSKPNKQVRSTYDVLYALTPLKQALCAKDDSDNYCVVSGDGATSLKGALTQAGGSLNDIQNSLSYDPSKSLTRRAEDAIAANLTTFRSSNLCFLFREPDTDSASLCTSCTRSVLTKYFNFESDVLYAPGLTNSELLGRQSELVGAIEQKCGANFLNGAVQAAGGIQQGTLPNTSGAVSERSSSLFAIIAGGLTILVSSLL